MTKDNSTMKFHEEQIYKWIENTEPDVSRSNLNPEYFKRIQHAYIDLSRANIMLKIISKSLFPRKEDFWTYTERCALYNIGKRLSKYTDYLDDKLNMCLKIVNALDNRIVTEDMRNSLFFFINRLELSTNKFRYDIVPKYLEITPISMFYCELAGNQDKHFNIELAERIEKSICTLTEEEQDKLIEDTSVFVRKRIRNIMDTLKQYNSNRCVPIDAVVYSNYRLNMLHTLWDYALRYKNVEHSINMSLFNKISRLRRESDEPLCVVLIADYDVDILGKVYYLSDINTLVDNRGDIGILKESEVQEKVNDFISIRPSAYKYKVITFK